MVDKPEKFHCSKHPEKKALMCCIDKACKEKLLCESCQVIHDFKSKGHEVYNIKVLKSKEMINEVSGMVPAEVKDLIAQLAEIHQAFTHKTDELFKAITAAILNLSESSINLKQVEEQEKLANALFEEVQYAKTEENLVQYAEQFDKFAKIVKGIDVPSHKMKYNKLANLYKGLTNDFSNFVNGKVSDIANQLNKQSGEAPTKAGLGASSTQPGASNLAQSQALSTGVGIDRDDFRKAERGDRNDRIGGIDDVGYSRGPKGLGVSTSVPGEDFVASRLFNQPYSLELIYKASESDRSPQAFHKACDGISHTLVLVKVSDFSFGGYTDAIWSSEKVGCQKESKASFLFSVNGRKKFYIKPDHTKNAIYCRQNCGPVFGKGGLDLFVCNGSFTNNGSSPCSYDAESVSFGFTSSEKYQEFEVDDYEVYRVLFR